MELTINKWIMTVLVMVHIINILVNGTFGTVILLFLVGNFLIPAPSLMCPVGMMFNTTWFNELNTTLGELNGTDYREGCVNVTMEHGRWIALPEYVWRLNETMTNVTM
jgi:hypothetical protein